jgi:hypothetical protein
LPERITEKDAKPYLRSLPFILPQSIQNSLSLIDWESMPYYDQTPHYESKRIVLTDPKEALIHPKDKTIT